MCGIVFSTSKNEPVNNNIAELYENQHSRGTRGFGIVKLNNKFKLNSIDRSEIESIFIHDLFKSEAKTILTHHRTPTSTDNERDQTHPMLIDNRKLEHMYLVAHNGIIYNAAECRENFEKEKYKFLTAIDEKKFNDSEAFAYDLACMVEGKHKKWTARGTIAFVALQIKRKTQKVEKVLFGRNGNPLNLYVEKTNKIVTEIDISSEGWGEKIDEDTLFVLDLPTLTMKKKKFVIGKVYEYTKTDYGYPKTFDKETSIREENDAIMNQWGSRQKILQGSNQEKKNTTEESESKPEIDTTSKTTGPDKISAENIEEMEDGIYDDLASLIANKDSFGLDDIIEKAISELSQINYKTLYNRNRKMAEIAKLLDYLESCAEILHESWMDKLREEKHGFIDTEKMIFEDEEDYEESKKRTGMYPH